MLTLKLQPIFRCGVENAFCKEVELETIALCRSLSRKFAVSEATIAVAMFAAVEWCLGPDAGERWQATDPCELEQEQAGPEETS